MEIAVSYQKKIAIRFIPYKSFNPTYLAYLCNTAYLNFITTHVQ